MIWCPWCLTPNTQFASLKIPYVMLQKEVYFGEKSMARHTNCTHTTVTCLSPDTGHHGEFQAEVPLLLLHPPATPSDTTSSPAAHTQLEPYCTLTLSASVPPSTVSFSTSSILLQPVPLDITISAQYSLLLHNFPR